MTRYWSPSLEGDISAVRPDVPAGRFELAFFRHGARTAIGRQFVSYPFHMTRPFALDPQLPSLLTVYQQSSSGGLYRAESLRCLYEIGADAAAHVTTQAATIVHDCYGETANQTIEISLGKNAFLALTPDPLVLFPGARFSGSVEAKLSDGAVLLLGDAFSLHDPAGQGRPFDTLESDVVIRESNGGLLVRDSYRVAGDSLVGTVSPIGRWRVVSTYLLLGCPERLPPKEVLCGVDKERSVAVGVSALPNNAGWGVRCLAANAVAARVIADRIFNICVAFSLGGKPMARRK